MNLKKYLTAVVAVFISAGAFAYPAVQEDDQTAQFLQQYTQQIEELQKGFEKKLLPSFKAIAALALEVQASAQGELTDQQAQALEKHSEELDKNLTELLAPVLKDFDIAQFNEQYAQAAKTYGLPQQTFTLQEATDLFKGLYLVSALTYFEQTKKLQANEMAVLTEIFFPQEEEPEPETPAAETPAP